VTGFRQFGVGSASTSDSELAQALTIESMELLASPVNSSCAQKLAQVFFKQDYCKEAVACFTPGAPL